MKDITPVFTEYCILAALVIGTFASLWAVGEFVSNQSVHSWGVLARGVMVALSIYWGRKCWYVVLSLLSKPE